MIEIRYKETSLILHRVPADTLAGAQLRGWQLPGANLRGVDLRGADLQGTYLYGADLSGADLERASLAGARCWVDQRWLGWILACGMTLQACQWGMDLVVEFRPPSGWLLSFLVVSLLLVAGSMMGCLVAGSNYPEPGSTMRLRGASLRRADLARAELRGADLERADLQGAWMPCAGLQAAVLRCANLWGTNLESAQLSRAALDGADLRSAALAQANLDSANLRGADLRSADLRQANLHAADLRDTDLRGADVRARLAGAILIGARYDETTHWPLAFQPARHGCVSSAEVVPAPPPIGRGDEPSPSDLTA